jgi:hypothetical protein
MGAFERGSHSVLNDCPFDWKYAGLRIEDGIRELAGHAAKMPDAGIKAALVSSPLMLAQSPARNSRCQSHKQSASQQHRQEDSTP